MRRAVLLSLSVAAAVWLPSVARAQDICNQVWVESSYQNATTGPTCVSWPYSHACEVDRFHVDDIAVQETTCFPQP